MFAKLFKGVALTCGGVMAGGYATAYYNFPEMRDNQGELLESMRRSNRLVSTCLKIYYHYEWTDKPLEEKHRIGGRLLRDLCLDNGGFYIKQGQQICGSDTATPKEYIEELECLYQFTREDPYEEIKKVYEKDTGYKLEDIFDNFDPKPISSASMA